MTFFHLRDLSGPGKTGTIVRTSIGDVRKNENDQSSTSSTTNEGHLVLGASPGRFASVRRAVSDWTNRASLLNLIQERVHAVGGSTLGKIVAVVACILTVGIVAAIRPESIQSGVQELVSRREEYEQSLEGRAANWNGVGIHPSLEKLNFRDDYCDQSVAKRDENSEQAQAPVASADTPIPSPAASSNNLTTLSVVEEDDAMNSVASSPRARQRDGSTTSQPGAVTPRGTATRTARFVAGDQDLGGFHVRKNRPEGASSVQGGPVTYVEERTDTDDVRSQVSDDGTQLEVVQAVTDRLYTTQETSLEDKRKKIRPLAEKLYEQYTAFKQAPEPGSVRGLFQPVAMETANIAIQTVVEATADKLSVFAEEVESSDDIFALANSLKTHLQKAAGKRLLYPKNLQSPKICDVAYNEVMKHEKMAAFRSQFIDNVAGEIGTDIDQQPSGALKYNALQLAQAKFDKAIKAGILTEEAARAAYPTLQKAFVKAIREHFIVTLQNRGISAVKELYDNLTLALESGTLLPEDVKAVLAAIRDWSFDDLVEAAAAKGDGNLDQLAESLRKAPEALRRAGIKRGVLGKGKKTGFIQAVVAEKQRIAQRAADAEAQRKALIDDKLRGRLAAVRGLKLKAALNALRAHARENKLRETQADQFRKTRLEQRAMTHMKTLSANIKDQRLAKTTQAAIRIQRFRRKFVKEKARQTKIETLLSARLDEFVARQEELLAKITQHSALKEESLRIEAIIKKLQSQTAEFPTLGKDGLPDGGSQQIPLTDVSAGNRLIREALDRSSLSEDDKDKILGDIDQRFPKAAQNLAQLELATSGSADNRRKRQELLSDIRSGLTFFRSYYASYKQETRRDLASLSFERRTAISEKEEGLSKKERGIAQFLESTSKKTAGASGSNSLATAPSYAVSAAFSAFTAQYGLPALGQTEVSPTVQPSVHLALPDPTTSSGALFGSSTSSSSKGNGSLFGDDDGVFGGRGLFLAGSQPSSARIAGVSNEDEEDDVGVRADSAFGVRVIPSLSLSSSAGSNSSSATATVLQSNPAAFAFLAANATGTNGFSAPVGGSSAASVATATGRKKNSLFDDDEDSPSAAVAETRSSASATITVTLPNEPESPLPEGDPKKRRILSPDSQQRSPLWTGVSLLEPESARTVKATGKDDADSVASSTSEGEEIALPGSPVISPKAPVVSPKGGEEVVALSEENLAALNAEQPDAEQSVVQKEFDEVSVGSNEALR